MKILFTILLSIGLFQISYAKKKDKAIELDLYSFKGSKHIENLEVIKKKLHFEATTNDPYIIGSPLFEEMKGPARVYIRMQLDPEMKTSGTIYYLTDFDPNWNSKKTVSFTTIADGEFYNYEVDINTEDNIAQLRLDPSNSPGKVVVESIKIESLAK